MSNSAHSISHEEIVVAQFETQKSCAMNWICKILGHRWEKWRYANFKLGLPSVPIPGVKCVYRCTRKNCNTVWGRITPK